MKESRLIEGVEGIAINKGGRPLWKMTVLGQRWGVRIASFSRAWGSHMEAGLSSRPIGGSPTGLLRVNSSDELKGLSDGAPRQRLDARRSHGSDEMRDSLDRDIEYGLSAGPVGFSG